MRKAKPKQVKIITNNLNGLIRQYFKKIYRL